LARDPAAWRSFALQAGYRAAVLQAARRAGVALTADERAAVDATLPSQAATRDWLRAEGIGYDAYIKEAHDVALIQKMERRDVFDAVTVDAGELQRAFAAAAPKGPRRFITAIALVGGCARAAEGARLLTALGTATPPNAGHRLDAARLARAAQLDGVRSWALDLHLDGAGRPAAVAGYDRAEDALAPTVGPALVEALAAWAKNVRAGELFAPRCIDGSLWIARLVATADDRPLRFDEAADELAAPLLAARQKRAFDSYVDGVLAQAHVTVVPPANQEAAR
jgi:hypothetical protein